MTNVQKLGFYATPPHDCNYLSDREAVTLFADPLFPKNTRLYSALADCGFRRSGEHLYIPNCNQCNSCISVRLPINEFRLSRSQSRVLKQNRDLSIKEIPAMYVLEHFELYQKYLAARHAGGGMDQPTPESYMEFLTASWTETLFYEMRLNGKLISVAVVDVMENAFSAVYTFFDPDYSSRSLGRYAILYEIEMAKQKGLTWLYLGYWIEKCKKMKYKNQYQPLEYYQNNAWRREPLPT